MSHRPRLDALDAVALTGRRVAVTAHRARRLARWLHDPAFAPPSYTPPAGYPALHGRVEVPIDRADPDADPRLEAGKRHNLRLAAPHFDGLRLAPDRPLSFWRALGRITADRGYVYGLELRGGCLMPALGGGVCLLSNALFELAARLGWRIDERHGHTLEAVPPRPGELWGLDATVFWPYVDLRVAPRQGPARLSVTIDRGRLVVAAHGAEPLPCAWRLSLRGDRTTGDGPGRERHAALWRRPHDPVTGAAVGPAEWVASSRRTLMHAAERRRSCLTCGETACRARPELVPARLLEPGAE